MVKFLRISGVLLIASGFVFVLINCGMPYMFSENVARIYIGCAAVGLGWLFLIAHTVVFTLQNGWAASGITLPGMAVFGAGLVGAWWFLFGPRASSYPGIYGLGVLFLSLFVASQILTRVFKNK